tara:strand:+ start:12677 stop:13852 length:1176 start_codon:yes stop_codon:yes gene_type:complete
MTDSLVDSIVAKIHSAPHRLVFEFAGAGSLALAWLHSRGGSSRTVLEATDRYASLSTIELLGKTPDRFVASNTATAMATHAYQRGLRLGAGTDPIIGIGCTATIATNYNKRGNHGCRISVVDKTSLSQYSITFDKGARNRLDEETLVSKIVLNGLAKASRTTPLLPLSLRKDEILTTTTVESADPIEKLLSGRADIVKVRPDGAMSEHTTLRGFAFLSGAFNPLHIGHSELAEAASRMLGRNVLFDLSVQNADKGQISHSEICSLLCQFQWPHEVVLTRKPLFAQKALYFPDAVFIVGYDTALRILQKKYYSGDNSNMLDFLSSFREAGCRFLVAGRHWDGSYHTVSDLNIPEGYNELFQELPENMFRVDTSSSLIRQIIESPPASESSKG